MIPSGTELCQTDSANPESARKALSPRSEFLIGPVMAGDSAIPGLAVNTVGLLMRRSETASGKMPLLVCSLGRFVAQLITVAVVVSFWFFFFVDTVEMVDNLACRFSRGILSAWPCGKIGWEAEACRFLGLCEARNVDAPRLPSGWSTVEDRTLSWAKARICKTGPVATKPNERIVS